MQNTNSLFLKNAIETSLYYKSMAENSLKQVSDKQIHTRFNNEDNNIATIAKHIAGNLLSRWTNFGKVDGEKPWRNRDSEFIDDLRDKESLLVLWDHGWNCFIEELQKLKPEDVLTEVYIRKEKNTVFKAIQRQLNHNSYHIGQMVLLAKSLKGSDWKSLSIPKNKSKDFNKNMGMNKD